MTLSQIRKAIKKNLDRNERGKKVKTGKIKGVLENLEQKAKRFEKALAKGPSAKERKALELDLKIAKAQIKKARKLL